MGAPRRTATIVTAIALVALLGACTDDDPDGVSVVGLNGIWQGDCVPDEDNSIRIDNVIGGTAAFAIVTTNFRDAGCRVPFAETRLGGRYSISGQRVVATGETADEIDLTLDSIGARYLDADAVAAANRLAICGRSDWQLNVSIDISACPDLGVALPQTSHDLLYRVDDVFYVGDESGDGGTPETRPTGIDFTQPFRRTSG